MSGAQVWLVTATPGQETQWLDRLTDLGYGAHAWRLTGGHDWPRATPPDALVVAGNDSESELLLLRGRPIGDPVAHHGPFVMNAPHEIEQAIVDYRRTGFGGWPWGSDGPVHPREDGRFAIHADGRREDP